jgi:hypothetical protein
MTYDTDSDGLTHVTNSETSERRVFSEGLNAPRKVEEEMSDEPRGE